MDEDSLMLRPLSKETAAIFSRCCDNISSMRSNFSFALIFSLIGIHFYTLAIYGQDSRQAFIAGAVVTVISLCILSLTSMLSLNWGHSLKICMFLATCSAGIALLGRSMNGRCESTAYSAIWSCNPTSAASIIPQDNMLLVMVLPIVYGVSSKVQSLEFILLNWITGFAFILASILASKSYWSFPMLVYYVPISLCLIYEIKRGQLAFFREAHSQRMLLDRTNNQADAMHATEMRHMIANVAHDLKTVRKLSFLLYDV